MDQNQMEYTTYLTFLTYKPLRDMCLFNIDYTYIGVQGRPPLFSFSVRSCIRSIYKILLVFDLKFD